MSKIPKMTDAPNEHPVCEHCTRPHPPGYSCQPYRDYQERRRRNEQGANLIGRGVVLSGNNGPAAAMAAEALVGVELKSRREIHGVAFQGTLAGAVVAPHAYVEGTVDNPHSPVEVLHHLAAVKGAIEAVCIRAETRRTAEEAQEEARLRTEDAATVEINERTDAALCIQQLASCPHASSSLVDALTELLNRC